MMSQTPKMNLRITKRIVRINKKISSFIYLLIEKNESDGGHSHPSIEYPPTYKYMTVL